MPAIEVYLTARSASRDDLKGKTVLVIDVLRACSTIVSALDNGARAIIPVADMAEAGKIAEHMDGDTMVMGGERGGVKIEGYQLGNSPLEYTPEVVQGKVVVLNTSNGTRRHHPRARGRGRRRGSFLNISECISFAAETSYRRGDRVRGLRQPRRPRGHPLRRAHPAPALGRPRARRALRRRAHRVLAVRPRPRPAGAGHRAEQPRPAADRPGLRARTWRRCCEIDTSPCFRSTRTAASCCATPRGPPSRRARRPPRRGDEL
jgi:hypothetical protein